MIGAKAHLFGDTPAAGAVLLALGRGLALSGTASHGDLATAAADPHAEAAGEGVALDPGDVLDVVRLEAA